MSVDLLKAMQLDGRLFLPAGSNVLNSETETHTCRWFSRCPTMVIHPAACSELGALRIQCV